MDQEDVEMNNRSPFTLNRFELEDSHIYFLPDPIFPALQSRKSAVLRGSRGTGKTTLLRALNWNEQISNPSLQRSLSGDFTSRACLGIYLKLTLAPLSLFGRWLVDSPDLQSSVFSTYLDFLWIEPLFEALAALANRRILKANIRSESEACATFLDLHPELISERGRTGRQSFQILSELTRHRRLELETLARTRAKLSNDEIAKRFPLRHYGALGRAAAQMTVRFCADCTKCLQPWHVKVCFDEAECMDELQQKTLNTAVRLTDSNLSYVTAVVGTLDEPVATHISGISLQRADREFIDLEPADQDGDQLDEDFVTLAEGVSNARIRSVAPDTEQTFSTTALLGTLDINSLLLSILKDSESPAALQMLRGAEKLRKIYTARSDNSSSDSTLPIYQAYLIDRLGLPQPNTEEPKERRRQESAELRKKMVAAYLCICAELRVSPRYAYKDMLIQTSDRCLRDFLWQMDEIYCRSKVSIAEFCMTKIFPDAQDTAMKAASQKKRDYVELAGISTPTETLRLIEALGRLTARLQGTTVGQRGLRSTERGIFRIDISSVPKAHSTLKIVTEAAEAGFLKIIEHTPQLRFRVHCSLAANYGFSYRGAYYDTPIRLSDLTNLISQPDDKSLDVALRGLEEWLGTDASTDLPLFEGQP